MTNLFHPNRASSSAAASRRSLMRALTAGAFVISPFSLLLDQAEARRSRKKSRRKKKRGGQPPVPQVRADATCPGPAQTGFKFGPHIRVAQSFTAGLTGDLVHADLVMIQVADNDGEYLLRLAPLLDGVPTDVALATARVDDRRLPDGETVVTLTFNQPARVTAGDSYALVLARVGEGEYTWRGRSGGCPGRTLIANGLTAPFEPIDADDFLFTTFVRV